MSDDVYEIEAVGLVFYSQIDESKFSDWLDGEP
jgi:hypothetical protein